MTTLTVTLPAARYDITITSGALSRVGELTKAQAPHRRALLVVDRAIVHTHGEVARRSLQDAGYDVAEIHLEASETHKTLQVVQRIYGVMLAHRLERSSPVVAVGGGIVGDVAGFAAATYLRGVPLIQVPTTLLAMVDAAIGGKTGVNASLPEGGMGKNLIGAFWQPRAVVIDPHTLRTLDKRHLRSGLAESIKHAMIADGALLDVIAHDADALVSCDLDTLATLIARSAAVKVKIVQDDEREAGNRALLNLGHTFAHAMEPIAELDLHHGEAVAIGLCAATHGAMLLGMCNDKYAMRVQSLLNTIGLPVRMAKPIAVDQLMQAMLYDKKVTSDKLRLILPCEPGVCRIVEDVPLAIVQKAWQHIGAV